MSLICCPPLPFSYQWVWDGMGPYAWYINPTTTAWLKGNSFNDSLMIFECCACAWFDVTVQQHGCLNMRYLIAQTSWKAFGAWCFWVLLNVHLTILMQEDDLPDMLVEAFESVHSHITVRTSNTYAAWRLRIATRKDLKKVTIPCNWKLSICCWTKKLCKA